jgi:hypothetical protein
MLAGTEKMELLHELNLCHSPQLDDPLSGLDATTKLRVFREAIGPGSITAGYGRVLVTQTRMCQ